MRPEQGWTEQANAWITWARTPGHDSYWHYRTGFLDFLPKPGKSTLDIGCGEGRVSRDLSANGHRVSGVDVTTELVEAARAADPTGDYRQADAAALPFDDNVFDLVVAYNMLMDVSDVPGTVREAARVLRPGGVLAVSVVHPMTDAAGALGEDYLGQHEFHGAEERDGLRMEFHGWRRPLSAYTDACTQAGLVIEALHEPPRPDKPLMPLFLWLRTRLPAS
ncbi:class I SAM-dependent methyltransferase [Tamaricihabitans halophyticus]|nr:class I SAM-dependent methyltransferase [Tamaricihabitans halophyticus]